MNTYVFIFVDEEREGKGEVDAAQAVIVEAENAVDARNKIEKVAGQLRLRKHRLGTVVMDSVDTSVYPAKTLQEVEKELEQES